ncbi:MAG TPA: hypothetical protein VFI12_07680 [Thermomicrobiales bacterium]|nr:hypothetical protein [Thermomicrobiales bacterium]
MQMLQIRRSVVMLLIALCTIAAGPNRAGAQPGTQSALVAVTGQGTGRVLIAPNRADQGTFAAQITVTVHGAAPGTTFTVARAADLVADGVCTGPTFAAFPGAILTTSGGGAGVTHIDFHRGAPFVSGISFDVVFQLAGSDGSLLESDCMTVTVL